MEKLIELIDKYAMTRGAELLLKRTNALQGLSTQMTYLLTLEARAIAKKETNDTYENLLEYIRENVEIKKQNIQPEDLPEDIKAIKKKYPGVTIITEDLVEGF